MSVGLYAYDATVDYYYNTIADILGGGSGGGFGMGGEVGLGGNGGGGPVPGASGNPGVSAGTDGQAGQDQESHGLHVNAGSSVTFTNNIIAHGISDKRFDSSVGVSVESGATVTLSCNNIGNHANQYVGIAKPASDIAQNPQLIN
jgi:hypothetical protein